MPTLELTNEQAIALLQQLPMQSQEVVLKALLEQRWQHWQELSHEGEARIRQIAAERGCDWDAMSEQERELFVDDLLHEDEP